MSGDQANESRSVVQKRASLRWAVYGLLIAVSLSSLTARIMRVQSSDVKHPSPFLSANDRSRWSTIRALGDHGTYVLDDIIFDEQGNRVRGWHTIDLVKHRGPDGREHYYSSKPTLMPTLFVGPYLIIKAATGTSLEDKTFYVARLMLVVLNVVPLGIALYLLAAMVDRLGLSDWGRIFVMTCAAFGTFATTFSITLNNHVTAIFCVVYTLAAAWPIWRGESNAWWRFSLAGLFAALTAANELPALSFLAVVAASLGWKAPLRTAVAFGLPALVVAGGAFGTNYIAHGTWKTAYAHRKDGPVITTIEIGAVNHLDRGRVSSSLRHALQEQQIPLSDQAKVEVRTPGQRWSYWDEPSQTRLALVKSAESGSGVQRIEVREWDNWYDYEGTYWTPSRLTGVDRGEPSAGVYALHALVGHHGIFSLTPVWILSFLGLAMWLRSGDRTLQAFAAAVLLLTIVVLLFYLSRPQIDRNYGGVTSGLRWMFWFTPLWLLTMLPASDWMSRNRARMAIAIVLLAMSVFSANYGAMNPWSHPWLFDYWTQLGWINY
jgi:hypothetical protein